MESIPLAALLPSDFDPSQFKLHCAGWNGKHHPIDILAEDMDRWADWQSWRPANNDFNRQFIFSLAEGRRDKSLWLFGGIWEVLGDSGAPNAHSYEVVLREDLMGPFIRRLYVRLDLGARNRRRKMEGLLDEMTVVSIVEEPFEGEPFPGLDSIDVSLADLQMIVKQQRHDWRIALENMKGVYVIHDEETGKAYVGSAYGDPGDDGSSDKAAGIWQRWSNYTETLHGGNKGLKKHLQEIGEDAYRQRMRFALLEFWSHRTDAQRVLDREKYWKQVLLSNKHGLNEN